jgi:hypothetical protein
MAAKPITNPNAKRGHGAGSGAVTGRGKGTDLAVSSAMQTKPRISERQNNACGRELASFSFHSRMNEYSDRHFGLATYGTAVTESWLN